MLTDSLREEALAEIRRKFAFQYIDLNSAELLHFVPIGMSGWVCVLGNPENASYEWVVRHDQGYVLREGDPSYDRSDAGYGGSAYALRDALNKILDD